MKYFFCLSLLLLSSCQQATPLQKHSFHFGTFIDITLYDTNNTDVFNQLFATLTQLEKDLTLTSESELTTLNYASGSHSVTLTPSTCEIFNAALHYTTVTDGHFNLALQPITHLWNFSSDTPQRPSSHDITTALPLTNYDDIQFNASTCQTYLTEPHMGVDLGGIAKGYALDVLKAQLNELNIESALLNVGGNILAHGTKPNREPFNIGIQDPYEPRGTHLGVLSLTSKSVATSGPYERNFEEDGVFYHHILNAATGYPVENELASVSIICESGTCTDALSTAIFSMGLKDGLAFIQSLPDVEAIFVTNQREIFVTSGLANTFKLTNHKYTPHFLTN